MSNILILPIILSFLSAVVLLSWRQAHHLRRWFAAIVLTSVLGLSLAITAQALDGSWLVLRLGGWMPPFGIVLSVDIFAGIMMCLTNFVGVSAILFGFAETPLSDENPLRLPLFFFLIAGLNMAFATGDIFNLYVAFEVMLISSYALMTLEADNFHIKHALPYVAINLFSSALFLMAAALTYSLLGTLNYADIALRSHEFLSDSRLTIVAILYTLAFGIKAGMFPLYYWLPKSYPTMPMPLSGFYGGILTKVGVYALFRLFVTILPHNLTEPHLLVLFLSAPTMIFGVLGALSKGFVRGILSYHIISQVGFILLALGFFTPLGLTACVFYIMHHIIVKASLFLIGGVAKAINKTDSLKDMGHLWKNTPVLGVLFLIQALSLAGIPPLSGFWGKYLIIVEGLNSGYYFFVAASVFTSVFTTMSMLKIWLAAFWSEPEHTVVDLVTPKWKAMTAVVVAMTIVSLVIGLGANHFYELAEQATKMAYDQKAYVEAVLHP